MSGSTAQPLIVAELAKSDEELETIWASIVSAVYRVLLDRCLKVVDDLLAHHIALEPGDDEYKKKRVGPILFKMFRALDDGLCIMSHILFSSMYASMVQIEVNIWHATAAYMRRYDLSKDDPQQLELLEQTLEYAKISQVR